MPPVKSWQSAVHWLTAVVTCLLRVSVTSTLRHCWRNMMTLMTSAMTPLWRPPTTPSWRPATMATITRTASISFTTSPTLFQPLYSNHLRFTEQVFLVLVTTFFLLCPTHPPACPNLSLTLWRMLLLYGYSYKASCVRPAYAVIYNFWHPGTLTLRAERQSARMSKIINDSLSQSDTGCFIQL